MMKHCKSVPSKDWDSLAWLAVYKERVERLKKLGTLSAPYNVMAREVVLILHAIAHLSPNGGYSDPEAVRCVIRFLDRDMNESQKTSSEGQK